MPLFAAALIALTATIAQGDALRIVVIEGEDAVNIVQQKTAVAPVVEVRDRNNQPVAGAIVRFAIQQGRGSFAGARTISVTTNAAGRAVAAGLTPTGNGALQIAASASFQGQTAVATITQTNVMTAAQAAGASSGASSAASGGGAGSGGISGTTIGVVSGVAAAGTLVAVTQSGSSDVPPPAAPVTYRGSFSMQSVYNSTTFSNGAVIGFCANQPVSITGNVTVTLTAGGSGSIEMDWTENVGASGQCPGIAPAFHASGAISNSASIVLASEFPAEYQSNAGTVRIRRTEDFSGSLDGSVVNGKVTMFEEQVLIAPLNQALTLDAGFPATTATVTLTRQ